jgi:hypothetical protein
LEVTNAQSFPIRGVEAVLSGSKALYMPRTIHDGMVSVRTWSSDDDGACLVTRYQDEFNYYRMCLSFDQTGLPTAHLGLRRITNTEVHVLGTSVIANVDRSPPGHVIGIEAVGQTLNLFLDGARIATYEDAGGYTYGRVGIEDMLLKDAHFDDFSVVAY